MKEINNNKNNINKNKNMEQNIPTKLIIITYKDKTIESYE